MDSGLRRNDVTGGIIHLVSRIHSNDVTSGIILLVSSVHSNDVTCGIIHLASQIHSNDKSVEIIHLKSHPAPKKLTHISISVTTLPIATNQPHEPSPYHRYSAHAPETNLCSPQPSQSPSFHTGQ